MQHTRPIHTLELFPELNSHLIQLLKSLTAEEWQMPTVCKLWCVKDIASHLLDGNIRRISMQRDGYFPPGSPTDFESYGHLVAYLNALNADWVKATKRMSPELLISLLQETNDEVYHVFQQLEPDAPALFAVAWAGEITSPNWFDIAREYTERWLHQQQIRQAVEKPGIMYRKLYYPFLDTFMRALPLTYKSIFAPEKTVIQVTVTGEASGNWFLVRENGEWILVDEPEEAPASKVKIAPQIAWRLFSKGIDKDTAQKDVVINGDTLLGSKVMDMVSIMA